MESEVLDKGGGGVVDESGLGRIPFLVEGEVVEVGVMVYDVCSRDWTMVS